MHPRFLLVAVQSLTRLPVGDPVESDRDTATATGWYGIIGALVGGLAGFAWWASSIVLPRPTAATIALVTMAALTGARQYAGMASAADGLFGGSDPDQRLQVMRAGMPHRMGVTGGLALVMVVVLQVTLLAVLSPAAGAAALVSAASLGRGISTLALVDTVAAYEQGPAVALLDNMRPLPALLAAATAVVATTVFAGLATIAVLIAAAAMAFAVRGFAVRQLGGLTDEVIGGMILLVELAALGVLVALEVGPGL